MKRRTSQSRGGTYKERGESRALPREEMREAVRTKKNGPHEEKILHRYSSETFKREKVKKEGGIVARRWRSYLTIMEAEPKKGGSTKGNKKH